MIDPKASQADLERVARLFCEKMDPALLGLGSDKTIEFLSRVGSPAPRRLGPDGRPLLRWQDDLIEREITPGASVLDLGCGSGELLIALMRRKQVRAQGVELDPEAVFQCVANGVPVLHRDVDGGLEGFADRSFDYVILEETLQTLHRPVAVLKDMLRVGRRGIVSFPNFAYWRVRLDLGVRGRMPVTQYLPYRWYDTPNIHLFTLQDFLEWTAESRVRVVEGYVLAEGVTRALQPDDNLYAEEALVIVEKNDNRSVLVNDTPPTPP